MRSASSSFGSGRQWRRGDGKREGDEERLGRGREWAEVKERGEARWPQVRGAAEGAIRGRSGAAVHRRPCGGRELGKRGGADEWALLVNVRGEG